MLPEPTEVQEFDEESERGAYGRQGSNEDIYQRKGSAGEMKYKLKYYNSTLILYTFLRLRDIIQKLFFFIRDLVKRVIEKCINT